MQDIVLNPGVYTYNARVKDEYRSSYVFSLWYNEQWNDYEIPLTADAWRDGEKITFTLEHQATKFAICAACSADNPVLVREPMLEHGTNASTPRPNDLDLDEKVDEIYTHPPRISETTKNWEVWTLVGGVWQYVDTGRTSVGDDGRAPVVGPDGYWYEYDKNTGTYTKTEHKATGRDGLDSVNFHVSRETIPVQCNADGSVVSFDNTGLKIKLSRESYVLWYTPYGVTDLGPEGGGDYCIAITTDGVSGFALPTKYKMEVEVNNISGLTKDVGTVTLTFTLFDFKANATYQVQRVITYSKVKVGATGRGIVAEVDYYLATNLSMGVTRNTSGWSTTVQTLTPANNYLWHYRRTEYSSGTKYEYTTPSVIGTYGTQGLPGKMPIKREWKAGDTYRNNDEVVDYIYLRSNNKWLKLLDGVTSHTPDAAYDPDPVTNQDSVYEELSGVNILPVQILIAEEANVGGFIFKENQFLSQRGKLTDGTYASFDNQPGWTPNLRLNGVDGSGQLAGGRIRWDENGNLYTVDLVADRVFTPFRVVTDTSEFAQALVDAHSVMLSGSGNIVYAWEDVYLPSGQDKDGLAIRVFAPHGFNKRIRIRPAGTGIIYDTETDKYLEYLTVFPTAYSMFELVAFWNSYKGRLDWVLTSRYSDAWSTYRNIYVPSILKEGKIIASGRVTSAGIGVAVNNYVRVPTWSYDSASGEHSINFPDIVYFDANGNTVYKKLTLFNVIADVCSHNGYLTLVTLSPNSSTGYTFKVKVRNMGGSTPAISDQDFNFTVRALLDIPQTRYDYHAT